MHVFLLDGFVPIFLGISEMRNYHYLILCYSDQQANLDFIYLQSSSTRILRAASGACLCSLVTCFRNENSKRITDKKDRIAETLLLQPSR